MSAGLWPLGQAVSLHNLIYYAQLNSGIRRVFPSPNLLRKVLKFRTTYNSVCSIFMEKVKQAGTEREN